MTSKHGPRNVGHEPPDRQQQPDDARENETEIEGTDEVNPARHANDIHGPLGRDAMHATESKVDHAQGKNRHGVGQRRGRAP